MAARIQKKFAVMLVLGFSFCSLLSVTTRSGKVVGIPHTVVSGDYVQPAVHKKLLPGEVIELHAGAVYDMNGAELDIAKGQVHLVGDAAAPITIKNGTIKNFTNKSLKIVGNKPRLVLDTIELFVDSNICFPCWVEIQGIVQITRLGEDITDYALYLNQAGQIIIMPKSQLLIDAIDLESYVECPVLFSDKTSELLLASVDWLMNADLRFARGSVTTSEVVTFKGDRSEYYPKTLFLGDAKDKKNNAFLGRVDSTNFVTDYVTIINNNK